MKGLLRDIRSLNQLGDTIVAEPFAGGAGAALSLLFQEDTHEIFINDADQAIHDFWWSLLYRPTPFIEMLDAKRASMAEWRRQRSVYRRTRGVSRLDKGFATFYLNRCNRSGIIVNGGPIGGHDQTGKWKIGARYNKHELRTRCQRIAEYRDRIQLSCVDGIEFIAALDPQTTTFFVDPPYYGKGHLLYMNALDETYHQTLAEQLHEMATVSWVLTYDDCPEIRRLYEGWATVRPFSLRYAASERRNGNELLIVPRWMRLPETQSHGAIIW